MLLPKFDTVELKDVFHGMTHSAKRLIFYELKTISTKRDALKVEPIVTTSQMQVLDLFNAHNTLNYEKIQRKTEDSKREFN